jgi:hypothetical protein
MTQPFDHSRKVECRGLVPVGHPRIALTQRLAEKICDLVAGDKTICKIGDMEGLPSRATIRRWIAENEEFRRAYALAKEGLVEDIPVRPSDDRGLRPPSSIHASQIIR